MLDTHESMMIHETGVFRALSNHVLLTVAMLRATPGSKYACTYVKTTASVVNDAADSWYPDKTLEYKHFYFDYSTIFVPENDYAKAWMMAGNSGLQEQTFQTVLLNTFTWAPCTWWRTAGDMTVQVPGCYQQNSSHHPAMSWQNYLAPGAKIERELWVPVIAMYQAL